MYYVTSSQTKLKYKPQADITPETLHPTRLTDALAVLKILFIVLLLTRGQSSQLQLKGGAAAIAVASSSTVRGDVAVVVVLRQLDLHLMLFDSGKTSYHAKAHIKGSRNFSFIAPYTVRSKRTINNGLNFGQNP